MVEMEADGERGVVAPMERVGEVEDTMVEDGVTTRLPDFALIYLHGCISGVSLPRVRCDAGSEQAL